MKLFSPAFHFGQPLPIRFTRDGDDVSPPLRWIGVPPGTASLAIVCEDPDAPGGIWTHWILHQIPPDLDQLLEGIPKAPTLPSGLRQGINDFRMPGWSGPSPPPGRDHHYYLKLIALDAAPIVGTDCDATAFKRAIRGHELADASLMGTYRREPSFH